MGALTENHKCPPRIMRRVTDAVSTVGVGSVSGAILALVLDEHATTALMVAAAALGAVLAVAVRQAIVGKPS